MFHIYLPLIESTDSPQAAKISHDVWPSLHGETLLLVDDEEVVLNATQAVLEKLGYHVIIAHDGREGLLYFLEHRNQIDAIISDVVMPRSDGVTMFRQIRTTAPSMRIIFMTGYDQDQIDLQPDEKPFSSITSKPVQIAELSQQIRAMLERSR